MANEFYDHTTYPSQGAAGSSAALRAELDSIEAGFDKLPTMAGNGGKLVAINAGGTALESVDTTGTGDIVRNDSPTLVTPDIGTPSAGDATNLTNTIAPQTHAATSKATPVDADELPLVDSAASNGLKKLTWANLKATLKTYFDGLYATSASVTSYVSGLIGVTIQAYDVDIPTTAASQAEMEAGTEAALRSMSPLRVNQAIAALSSGGGAVQGNFKNLVASATGNGANISISADEIVVESAVNTYQTLRNVSLAGSLAASGANGLDDSAPQAVAVMIASPGVFTLNNHGFLGTPWNSAVVLATTGALPTGLSAGTTYYVVNPTTNNFQLSATKGGAAINTSGSQSGVHTIKSVLAVNSWYSKWVIWNGTTTAALLSSSATNPVLPTGYTHKARTGWVPTDGSGSKLPLSFLQNDDDIQLKVVSGSNVPNVPLMASGAAGAPTVPTWVAVSWANYAPPTANKIHVIAKCNNGAVLVAPNNAYGNKDSFTNPPPIETSVATVFTSNIELMVESSNIYWASDGSQNLLGILGWRDKL